MSAFKDIWQKNKLRWWTHREGASSTVYTMMTAMDIKYWEGICLSFMACQSKLSPEHLHRKKQYFNVKWDS